MIPVIVVVSVPGIWIFIMVPVVASIVTTVIPAIITYFCRIRPSVILPGLKLIPCFNPSRIGVYSIAPVAVTRRIVGGCIPVIGRIVPALVVIIIVAPVVVIGCIIVVIIIPVTVFYPYGIVYGSIPVIVARIVIMVIIAGIVAPG